MNNIINFASSYYSGRKVVYNYTDLLQNENNLKLYGDSAESPYIPFCFGFEGENTVLIDNNNEQNKVITYQIIAVNPSQVLQTKRYTDFNHSLLYGHSKYPYIIKNEANNCTYYSCRGMLYVVKENRINILFALVVDKNYIWEIDEDASIDYSKFCLIISKDFNNENHPLLYKRIQKDYFSLIQQNPNIDVIYTKNVNKYCFRTIKKEISFDSIDELRQYLTVGLNQTLHSLTRGDVFN